MKKNPVKKNPVKEKGVVDLTDPENKYVLSKFIELPIEKQCDRNFRNDFFKKIRIEYKKRLSK